MSSRFLKKLDCKVCGKAMELVDPDGGFTGGWSEEDERGNTIAVHWSRIWRCECGRFAVENAIDHDPYNDDPDGDYLEPNGAPDWYSEGEPALMLADGDACPNCGSENTERIDTIGDDPVIWICQCGSCAETFEMLIKPEAKQ